VPELLDLTVYLESLAARIANRRLACIRLQERSRGCYVRALKPEAQLHALIAAPSSKEADR
jgi:hypothetical protein